VHDPTPVLMIVYFLIVEQKFKNHSLFKSVNETNYMHTLHCQSFTPQEAVAVPTSGYQQFLVAKLLQSGPVPQ
jgi:hypothetical protein